jgi:pimeloyl-ACP methyl ester carboxylesterase
LKYPYHLHTLTTPQGELAYIDEGKGPSTLVFIHGLGSFIPAWEHNIVQLKKHFRCLALDLPGHGNSVRGDHPFSIYYYAEVVASFVQQLKLKNVILVGHSMGGQISVIFSIRYPSLLNKLVLAAPAGIEKFTPSEVQMMKSFWNMMDLGNAGSWQWSAGLKNNFYRSSVLADKISADMINVMQSGNRAEFMKMMQLSMWGILDEPVDEMLHLISVPVLLVFGEKDVLIPNPYLHSYSTEQLAREAVGKIPGAELLMIPNCGHYVQYENPEEFNRALHEFAKD